MFKEKKQIFVLFAVALGLGIIPIVFVLTCSPLKKKSSELREEYFSITKLDSNITQVKKSIRSELDGEILTSYIEGSPCERNYLAPVGETSGSRNRSEKIGHMSVTVKLGWYLDPVIPTYVFGQWCFNEEGKLIDIIINKESDSL